MSGAALVRKNETQREAEIVVDSDIELISDEKAVIALFKNYLVRNKSVTLDLKDVKSVNTVFMFSIVAYYMTFCREDLQFTIRGISPELHRQFVAANLEKILPIPVPIT